MARREYGERDFGRPSLPAVLAVMAGMAAAHAAGIERIAPGALVAALAAIAGLAVRQSDRVRTLSLVGAFFGVGLALQAPIEQGAAAARDGVRALQRLPGDFVVIEARVAGEPRFSAAGATVWTAPGARVQKAGESFVLDAPVALFLRGERGDFRDLAPGDTVMAAGKADPLAENAARGNPGRWAASQGAALWVWTARWECQPPERRDPWAALRLRTRRIADGIEAIIHDNMTNRPAAIMTAMMLGRTGHLDDAQRETFQRTGLAHLFAVSGLHTGLVGLMLAALATWCGLGPRWRAAIVIGGLIVFCLLTGLRTSALRATLLVSVFFLQPLVRRSVDPLGAIASVALILLAIRPRALWQVDFQLSFLCATTLVMVALGAVAIEEAIGRRLEKSWRLHWRALIRMAQVAFVTLCLQVALAPILMSEMGALSVVSPLANMIVLPLMLPVMALGFASVAMTAAMGVVGEPFFYMLEEALALMEGFAALLARLPGAAIENTRPWPVWMAGIYYLLLLGGQWIRLRPRFTPYDSALSAARQCAAAMLVIVWVPLLPRHDAPLRVTFLDVGQGDAILVEGGGATMLVDAGPGSGEALARELRDRGVEQLDFLVLTHADADHIAGAPGLIAAMPVRQLLVGGSIANTAVWGNLSRVVRWHELPVTTVRRGAEWQLGDGVAVRVLHPGGEFTARGDERNDASVVLRVETGGVVFLLTGDAERAAEAAMAAEFGPQGLAATVLKAGHHGSDSSTTMPFLAAVRPSIAIISCGRANRYGHPHPNVLARLAEMGTQVLRTDQHGTITIETDGRTLDVRTARGMEVLRQEGMMAAGLSVD